MYIYWPSDVRAMELSQLKVNVYWPSDVRAMDLSQFEMNIYWPSDVTRVIESCLS